MRLAGLTAIALLCVLSVTSASAQTPPPRTDVRGSAPPPGVARDGAARTPRAQASADENCTRWYVASKVGLIWQTRRTWFERYCANQGFKGDQTAIWYDFYFWTNGGYWSIYGSWTRYHDGCWEWWDVASLRFYAAPGGRRCTSY